MADFSKFELARMSTFSVCSISLNMYDRIRLIGTPSNLTPAVREAISKGWGKGIQAEREYYGTHEFKLSGNPWMGTGEEAVMSRRLVTYLLICMARNGWNLIQSTDVSKKPGDKDTLFFESARVDPDVQMFAVSFNMTDRIRVVDAPNMMPYVKQAVETQWSKGIQNERDYYGSQEIKLAGNPWYADGKETVLARMLLNQILANLRFVGYKLYGSIDLNTGTGTAASGGMDLETWFLRKIGPEW